MAKIVRLTESDLTRIVRRVINEAQTERQIASMIEGSDCFDAGKYPALWKFTKGSVATVAGVGMMALSIFGLATGPVAYAGGAVGFTTTVKGIHGIQNLNYDKVADELIEFLVCVGLMDEDQKETAMSKKTRLVNGLKSQG